MRSRRIGLKDFLFKCASQRAKEGEEAPFNAGRCPCDEGSQTPEHILFHCPVYADLREVFLNKVLYKTDLGRSMAMDYNAVVSHPQACRYAAEFMHRTGLLGQFREVEHEDLEVLMKEAEDLVNDLQTLGGGTWRWRR